jgi:pimeloyl-ACP methyl ester carboxylesterase
VSEVSDRQGEIDGLPIFWRSAPMPPSAGSTAADAPAVPLYLHGVPSNSDDWLAFLARGGGLAPDLPGFGRSGKPGLLRFTISEYDRFIERFLELAGATRVSLVMHDWGAVGLAFAQRRSELVQRVVLINAVPLLPGYRWHRMARIWRTPVLGELAMGSATRRVMRLASRRLNAAPGPMPEAWLDSVEAHFDQGTQRAILRLYRGASPEALEQAGCRLEAARFPALVVWGLQDPLIPASLAHQYASVLHARLVELPDAGHVPWLDRPDLVGVIVDFLLSAANG